MFTIENDKPIGLKEFLTCVKSNVSNNNFVMASRDKNIKFINKLGFNNNDIKLIILKLLPLHAMNKTAEKDDSGYPGFIYKFNLPFKVYKIYIKIRYCPPNKVVCISFHESEY